MKTEMTREEYTEMQSQLVLLARMLPTLDYEGFLEHMEKAEAVGPLLDPTLYLKASENMRSIKELAQALQTAAERCKVPLEQLTEWAAANPGGQA